MPLPELIEILPLETSAPTDITVPGSKSITNRALILAALAQGQTTLRGALWSEDTQIMVEALAKLGFQTSVEQDPRERANRRITVKGANGRIPVDETDPGTIDIYVGNAGTAARFLPPLLCLGAGAYRLSGTARMRDRPQAPLFQALRQLGYSIEADKDRFPAVIHGGGARAGRCSVSIEESSQFASGLLLCARHGQWQVEAIGKNAEESPYVVMTSKLVEAFPRYGGDYRVEPDASSGSYFWAANSPLIRRDLPQPLSGPAVRNWPESGWQVDARFPEFLAKVLRPGDGSEVSRHGDLGDSIMTLIALAPLASKQIRFTDLGRLRHQECERVLALKTELQKCGASVRETGDTLEIEPSSLHGAEIETYNDHRMAMCFAILGLRIPGIRLRNPSCVKKTFPDFFQKLSSAPPEGLGVTILDGTTGRHLALEELFAE